MNKKKLHHLWVRLKPVSYWYFLIMFVLSALVAVSALRQNNLKMIQLRESVTKADEQGTGVEEALRALREHVYSHMNTDLATNNSIRPPIQLKHTYQRLSDAERERVSELNKKVSNDAVAYCEGNQPSGLLTSRAQCVADYVTRNGVQERPITKELYQFDFVSPVWSPDLAGWSIVLAALFFLLFVLRFGLERWLKHQLD